jgi:hypothetical protein
MRLCWFNDKHAMIYNNVTKRYTLVNIQKWRLQRSKLKVVQNVN